MSTVPESAGDILQRGNIHFINTHDCISQTSDQTVNPTLSMPEHRTHSFNNPFQIEDLLIFDYKNMGRVLALAHLPPELLAWSLHAAPSGLIQRVFSSLPMEQRPVFYQELAHMLSPEHIARTRHLLLDKLFWELTYWKTPELYEELVAEECLHPAIFQQLEPLIQNKIVLDAGAGCGRASFEACKHGTTQIHAVEPSPGLRRLFSHKLATAADNASIILHNGDFAHLPLPDQSIDISLACSSFTSEDAQGGEPGLAEFRRVTRKGGHIVIIWPRPEDRSWLENHDFHYVSFPSKSEMSLSFTSWQSAWRCIDRFYANNHYASRYLRQAQQPRIPFSMLGANAPCDYSWLQVQ